ncbi:FAD-dependent oxidoreductase [Mycobacterium helveticum]|uniref:FAD-dependent oxidoreductase n=1 Tax=Mycobacterium helveticum TaxID=2592811 RepID=UPI00143DA30C|nr:NAD(P)/FAD-dependent oxidoreductase [Mycobacterium helveticum]
MAFFPSTASLLDAHTVDAGGLRLSAEQILIATGAHSPRLEIPGIEHAITHVELLRREKLPDRLVIIGGGIVGFEFAYIFARLGVPVTVVARHDALVEADVDVRAAVLAHAAGLGIQILTFTNVDAISQTGKGYQVSVTRVDEPLMLEADCVLIAAGQQPATQGLGLEAVGVVVDHGVVTDETLRSSVPNIWAAGDVRRGALQRAMVAMYEGRLAAYNALHTPPKSIEEAIVPWMIGTTPPIAGVGITEREATDAGRQVGVHKVEYRHICPAALVMGEPVGFGKVIFDVQTGLIMGAQIFGGDASEIIQPVAFAMHERMTMHQFAAVITSFPSYLWILNKLFPAPRPGDRQ